MLQFTNAETNGILLLNMNHIVGFRTIDKQVFVLTTAGVEYSVKESIEEAGRLWDNLVKRMLT